jgi:phosphohistidine swiveling domain-containing protein
LCGHRGAAEVDVGVPRWAEDPAPVLGSLGCCSPTGPCRRTSRTGRRARHDENTLVGMPAAAGVATGNARIVHDPATARIELGDILATDPGWTPLFLTAGGLVTETGSPMAHGPAVAREYGIPAVICVPRRHQPTARRPENPVDGSSGTVQLAISDEAATRSMNCLRAFRRSWGP